MTIWSAAASGAIINDDSRDLYEIHENRLRFKDGSHGTLKARYLVTMQEHWRKIRITYRKAPDSENFVHAQLMQISLNSAAADWVFGISSQFRPTDAEEIRSVQSTASDRAIDYRNLLYYVGITITRVSSIPDLVLARLADDPQSARYEVVDLETMEGPSVQITASAEGDTESILSLRHSAQALGSGFHIWPPSPEFIGVQLSDATGLGAF